jgi:transposase
MNLSKWLIEKSVDDQPPADPALIQNAPNMKKPSQVGASTEDTHWSKGRTLASEGDARQLGDAALHRLRNEVVQLHLQGKARGEICVASGLSYTAVRKIIQLYQQGGAAALVPKLRGRQAGEKRRLLPEQEVEIQNHLLRAPPEPDGPGAGLWQRDAVARLVQRTCAMALPTRTMDHYLKRWGYKPSQTVFSNARREPQCKAIIAAARQQGATLLWIQVVDLPRPLASGAARIVFSSNNRGQARWLSLGEANDAANFVAFCDSLRSTCKGPLLLLADLLDPALRQTLEQWLAQNGAVQCCYLPSLEMAPTHAAVIKPAENNSI